MLTETTADKLASRMLAHNGIAAIWDAHVAAAAAHGLGKHDMAASLIEIAEAAERLYSASAVAQGEELGGNCRPSREPTLLTPVNHNVARGASPHRGPCRAGSCCSSPARCRDPTRMRGRPGTTCSAERMQSLISKTKLFRPRRLIRLI